MTDKIIMSLLVNTAVFSALFCAVLPLRKTAGKKASPLLMLALWAVVVIKLVIPFGFESGFSILPPPAAESGPYENAQTADGIQDALAETDNAAQPADHSINAPVQPTRSAYTEGNAASGRTGPAAVIGWTAAAFGIWGAGAVIVSLALCMSAANLRRRIKHSRAVTPQYILELLEQCKAELGISRGVDITVQSALDKPAIMGALWPVLVLPENAERLGEASLRHVLLHELTHLKGGDLWVIKFMNVLRALYWFNPLVWFCIRLIREDIETACDQSVLRALGQEHRLSYIGTVLSFAGRKSSAGFAAAMGLFDGRPSMERRIKGMYGKTKTGIKGRIIAVLIALIIFALSALTACRPAAENAINAERAESRWEYNKDYGSGRSLSVDAAVYSVEAETLSTLTVVPKPFENGENIKNITNLFCPDAKIYYQIQVDDASNQIVITSDLADDINTSLNDVTIYMTQWDGASPNGTVTCYVQGDGIVLNTEVSPDDSEEGYYLTAVEDGSAQANLVAISGESTSYIDFINRDSKFEKQDSSKGSSFQYESDSFNHENCATRDYLVTPGSLGGDGDYLKAKEKADGYVKGMGIDYMALNSVSRGDGSYGFYYTRTYNGLPETYVQTHTGTNVTAVDGAPAISLWDAEYLYIVIQNGNAVKARWENPSGIKSVDNGNSKMLPWEEIKQIFLSAMDDMMTLKPYEKAAGTNAYALPEGAEVVINRVELGYTKLLTEGTNNDYKLVPTWMFMGCEKYGEHRPKEGVNTGADMCIMTINAIDGTIIDRGQGL